MRITRAEARTFALATIVGTAAIWDVAFNFGAYNTIFFDKIFIIWATSLAVFCVSLVLPNEHMQVPWWGQIILVMPALWIVLAFLNEPPASEHEGVMLFVGLLVYSVCLPYTIYIITHITNPEFFAFRSRRLGIALGLILLFIGITAFLIGRNNYRFLSCEDFKISGNDLPSNCVSESPLDELF